MALPIAVPLVGYTLWGVTSVLKTVIPVLIKEINADKEKEAKGKAEESGKHATAADSSENEPSGGGCKDGVCPLPAKTKAVVQEPATPEPQSDCQDGVCTLRPRKKATESSS